MTKVKQTSRSNKFLRKKYAGVRTHTGNCDNKEVTQQSDCIDDQEQNKEGNLYLRVVYKTTKNKFSHLGVIFTDHILDQFISSNQSICVKGSKNIL